MSRPANVPPTMQDTRTHWVLIDHLCAACGGRVLESACNTGMTPGGNRRRRCSCCGDETTKLTGICWCGFSHRGQDGEGSYVCVAFKELEKRPFLLEGFLAHGCDPKRKTSEVGVMTRQTYYDLIRKNEG